ncbi:hypothetical protein JKP88DRAFT_172544 [Tribonema minus]|uniref:Peptidase A1 domain-containing protein n=1 Tax=Tribonema minus TaxID=303371 RepID=A0A836C777_9STRA|nr:hypothetical protein JKP88DRAFT_172544 [Tribonema minus]
MRLALPVLRVLLHALIWAYCHGSLTRANAAGSRPALPAASSAPPQQLTSRRGVLSAVVAATTAVLYPDQSWANVNSNGGRVINLPLENCGGSWCTLFAVEGNVFRGVLDTGSPFLTVAGSCTRRWGCFRGEGVPSGLDDTIEIYAGNSGPVSWKKGMLELGFLRSDVDDEGFIFNKFIFGVLSDELVSRPGGVFLGLVKYNTKGIRPTFLGQTDVAALRFDFPRRVLSLSRAPLIPRACADAVPLVDLRPLGDPVQHYAARAAAVTTKQRALHPPPPPPAHGAAAAKDVYVIFDTGTTGLAVSRALWDAEDVYARVNGGRPFRDVAVTLATEGGGAVTLCARRPLTTPLDLPWRGFNERAHLLVIGLDFMSSVVLTIDVDDRRLLWQQLPDADV